jgi:membrane protein implicated in regulation of membrane protease activity
MNLAQSVRSFFSIADAYHEPDPYIAAQVDGLGNVAVVCEVLRPEQYGQVEYRGRFWTALCLEHAIIPIGTRVKVIDRVELVLVVEPLAMPKVTSIRPKKRIEEAA